MNIFTEVFKILASHGNRAKILYTQKRALIIQLHPLQNI